MARRIRITDQITSDQAESISIQSNNAMPLDDAELAWVWFLGKFTVPGTPLDDAMTANIIFRVVGYFVENGCSANDACDFPIIENGRTVNLSELAVHVRTSGHSTRQFMRNYWQEAFDYIHLRKGDYMTRWGKLRNLPDSMRMYAFDFADDAPMPHSIRRQYNMVRRAVISATITLDVGPIDAKGPNMEGTNHNGH